MVQRTPELKNRLGELRKKVLLCHCYASQACHADVLIELYDEEFGTRRDGTEVAPPEAEEMLEAALQREAMVESEPDTDPDEGALPYGSGWVGTHLLTRQVGQRSETTARESRACHNTGVDV